MKLTKENVLFVVKNGLLDNIDNPNMKVVKGDEINRLYFLYKEGKIKQNILFEALGE